MIRLNPHPELLTVGQAVTTELCGPVGLVRHITGIRPDKSFESGYMACADGANQCPTCLHVSGRSIGYVDAAWFIPVEEKR